MENLKPMYSNRYGKINQRTPEEEPIHQGEYQLKQWFRNQGHYVIDVSDNEQFFDKDIDLLVTHKDIVEEPTAIEVKWDDKIATTGNLFVEYHTSKFDRFGDAYENKNGWFHFCKADLLFYGDAKKQMYYVFKYKEFKDYINQNQWRYKERSAFDKNRDGSLRRKSWGWLVPIEELQQNLKVQILRL